MLERRGQTEAGVELAKLAGLTPAGVICEVMADDGTMARLSTLAGFAAQHSIKIVQDDGLDTVEANHQLGFPTDTRSYEVAAHMLADLGISSLRLMTNNPAKVDGLARHGIRSVERVSREVNAYPENIAYVPGSFEIALAAQKMAHSKRYDAAICLGVLIRGSTPHFDYIASETSKGIAQTSWQSGIPVTFGVITTENIEQAIERSGSKAGNKGVVAAMAAIEMANLLKQMDA